MLDGIDPDTSSFSWFAIAGWVLGGIAVGLVLFGITGVIRLVSGKNLGSAKQSTQGLLTTGLALGGAVVLGISSGAIIWSATDSTYEDGVLGNNGLAGLMPNAARPGEVTVERQEAVVTCDSDATWESSGGGAPSDDEWAEAAVLVSAWGISNDTGEGGGIVEVQWYPALEEGECDSSNTLAEPGSTVTIERCIHDVMHPDRCLGSTSHETEAGSIDEQQTAREEFAEEAERAEEEDDDGGGFCWECVITIL